MPKFIFIPSVDSTVIPLGNIISQYKFQNNANDFVGSNNGTATNLSYVTGLVGKAGDFSGGTNSQVSIPDADNLSFGNGTSDVAFTMSLLFKQPSSVNNNFLWDGSAFIRGGNSNAIGSLSDWTHITFTYDGSGLTSGILLYVDGVLESMEYLSSGTYVAMENTATPVVFGKNPWNTSSTFSGQMDCTTFWDKELTDAEVLELATEELAGTDINP